MDRPTIFKIGLVALWVSIVFEVAATYIIKAAYYFGNDLFLNIIVFVPLLLIVFIAYQISKQKNLARIMFLVWFIIFVLPSSLIKGIPFVLIFQRGLIHTIAWQTLVPLVLIIISAILQAFALYIFFTKPSSLLFRRRES